MTTTIAIRVEASERIDIEARAERDKVSLSDYIRVRLGLRAEGPLNGADSATDGDGGSDMTAVLADHERRLTALEAERAAAGAA